MNEICYHLFLRSRLVRYVLGIDESVSERCIVHSMALYFACIDGHPDLVDRMIDLGAASRGLCFPGSSVSYLKKAFVDAVCEGPSNGWTALMLASMYLGLLKAGAAVDHAGSQGETALMLACENGHDQCLRILMAHMANHPFDDVDNVQPYSTEPPETARK